MAEQVMLLKNVKPAWFVLAVFSAYVKLANQTVEAKNFPFDQTPFKCVTSRGIQIYQRPLHNVKPPWFILELTGLYFELANTPLEIDPLQTQEGKETTSSTTPAVPTAESAKTEANPPAVSRKEATTGRSKKRAQRISRLLSSLSSWANGTPKASVKSQDNRSSKERSIEEARIARLSLATTALSLDNTGFDKALMKLCKALDQFLLALENNGQDSLSIDERRLVSNLPLVAQALESLISSIRAFDRTTVERTRALIHTTMRTCIELSKVMEQRVSSRNIDLLHALNQTLSQ